MKLVAFALAIAFVHLWAGALSGEGASRAHRLARASAIVGLVAILAFSLAVAWASLTFPPGLFGFDMLVVLLTGLVLVASTVASIGLSVALHVRARRGQA